MEKVKLTQEQAKAIEKLKSKNKGNVFYAIEEHAFTFADDDDYWLHEFKPLNDMGIADVAEVLVNGYEVEKTFEVGDWVVHENGKVIGQVTRIYEDELEVKRLGDGYIWNKKYVRHATPKEITEGKQRIWWRKHGREVWELREGDCLISKQDKHTCQVKFVEASDEVSVLLVDGIQDEFYEGEHDLEIMKDRYVVFCFAEDRKDMEGENE